MRILSHSIPAPRSSYSLLMLSPFNPEPNPGLQEPDFHQISANGFGDGNNAYAYSSIWYKEHLYVGTSRANLCMLKFIMPFVKMDVWPVDCPHKNYTPTFEHDWARSEIWRYSPYTDVWERVFQSPLVKDDKSDEFSRDLGYRAMVIYQGESDPEPALYVAASTRLRHGGPEILRSIDGKTFEAIARPHMKCQEEDRSITAIRVLTVFNGKLYTAPTGSTKGSPNASWSSLVYETTDPVSGEWRSINDPGFDPPPAVATVYELAEFNEYLYAGTAGDDGLQIWRTKAQGEPPYRWEKVLDGGAGRGNLNQGAVSMKSFKNALYIGTGIQNGGFDHRYGVGPAAAEIIRVHPDNSWDIVVGNARDGKEPISGLSAGFNNFFCGYIWRMGIHDNWLYAGSMDWTIILRFTKMENRPAKAAKLLAAANIEDFIACQGGFDLWRTHDGENWVPVTKTGFNNPYNYGCRNIISTPHGLFIGTANPFGPKVATFIDGEWVYRDNPDGGLEVLQGTHKRLSENSDPKRG